MKKALILISLFFAASLVVIVISQPSDKVSEKPNYVAVSSFPLYDITRHIVGDKIEIRLLMPFGVDAHSYMPSVKAVQDQLNADLFFYNGLGLEPWIRKELKQGIDMSRVVSLLQVDEEGEKHDEEGHQHETGEMDPHYWLNIGNMILMTRTISEKLVVQYPKYGENFKQNSKAYIDELNALDKEFQMGLKHCSRREIVVNHNAFGYLANAYHFHTHTLRGLSSDEQVSAKKMREITDLIQEEGITTIFFEHFASPKVAEAIATQTGIRTESLQPLANVTEEEADRGYILLMGQNLEKLQKAMECQ